MSINFESAKKLAHLSPEEIERLYERYINGEKSEYLVILYGIDVKPRYLYAIFPPVRLEYITCPKCNIPMYAKRRSKSQVGDHAPSIKCETCEHREFDPKDPLIQKCYCSHCKKSRLKADKANERTTRKNIRYSQGSGRHFTLAYDRVSILHKIVLLSWGRLQGFPLDHKPHLLLPLEKGACKTRLVPTDDLAQELVTGLRDSHVIIAPDTPIALFSQGGNHSEESVGNSRWQVNISLEGNARATLSEILEAIAEEFSHGIKPAWKSSIEDLIFRLATETVMQHILIWSEKYSVRFAALPSTREVVGELLSNFSVAEILYFANLAVEKAHLLYVSGKIADKRHAGNTIPQKILSLGQRSLKGNWDRYAYSRDVSAPQSKMSEILYSEVFKNPEADFYKCPRLHWDEVVSMKHTERLLDRKSGSLWCTECNSWDVEACKTANGMNIECYNCGDVTSYRSYP